MSNNEFRYQWPEVFETGVLDVSADDPHGKAKACADGLCGWANRMAGAEIPANFNKGMAAIGAFLGITPTANNLSEYGKQFTGEPTPPATTGSEAVAGQEITGNGVTDDN